MCITPISPGPQGRPDSFRRAVTRHGKTVHIVLTPTSDGRWALRVEGRRCHFTDWIIPFDSICEALAVALAAIRREGIEGFLSYRPTPDN